MPSCRKYRRKARKSVRNRPHKAASSTSQNRSQNPSLNTFDTFHGFQELPPELRLVIWEMTLPVSKVIFVRVHRERGEGSEKKIKFSCDSILPSLRLQMVSYEARDVAIRRYPFQLPRCRGVQYYNIRFGPQDQLFIENPDALIRNMAFDYDLATRPLAQWASNITELTIPIVLVTLPVYGVESKVIWRALAQLPNLRELRLVSREGTLLNPPSAPDWRFFDMIKMEFDITAAFSYLTRFRDNRAMQYSRRARNDGLRAVHEMLMARGRLVLYSLYDFLLHDPSHWRQGWSVAVIYLAGYRHEWF